MPDLSVFSDSPANRMAGSPKPVPTKLFYDRKSAAYVLSVSVRALDYLIAQRQLTAQRLGRKIMLSHSELVRFARVNHLFLTQAGEVQA